METKYTVAQAADMVGVKAYVLRYWEDELELRIGRNELGHRCYTGYDIQLFMNIKELKSRGLQLRAIKELIPQISRNAPGSSQSRVKLLEGEGSEDGALKEEILEQLVETEDGNSAEDTKILEFQQILERLIIQELQLKNGEEARCRSLDAAIRRQQLARREAAAAGEKRQRKHRKVHNGKA